MYASAVGHVKCVKVLMDNGAQANLQNKVRGAECMVCEFATLRYERLL